MAERSDKQGGDANQKPGNSTTMRTADGTPGRQGLSSYAPLALGSGQPVRAPGPDLKMNLQRAGKIGGIKGAKSVANKGLLSTLDERIKKLRAKAKQPADGSEPAKSDLKNKPGAVGKPPVVKNYDHAELNAFLRNNMEPSKYNLIKLKGRISDKELKETAIKILNHLSTQDKTDPARLLPGGVYSDPTVDYDKIEREAIALLIEEDVERMMEADSLAAKQLRRAKAVHRANGTQMPEQEDDPKTPTAIAGEHAAGIQLKEALEVSAIAGAGLLPRNNTPPVVRNSSSAKKGIVALLKVTPEELNKGKYSGSKKNQAKTADNSVSKMLAELDKERKRHCKEAGAISGPLVAHLMTGEDLRNVTEMLSKLDEVATADMMEGDSRFDGLFTPVTAVTAQVMQGTPKQGEQPKYIDAQCLAAVIPTMGLSEEDVAGGMKMGHYDQLVTVGPHHETKYICWPKTDSNGGSRVYAVIYREEATVGYESPPKAFVTAARVEVSRTDTNADGSKIMRPIALIQYVGSFPTNSIQVDRDTDSYMEAPAGPRDTYSIRHLVEDLSVTESVFNEYVGPVQNLLIAAMHNILLKAIERCDKRVPQCIQDSKDDVCYIDDNALCARSSRKIASLGMERAQPVSIFHMATTRQAPQDTTPFEHVEFEQDLICPDPTRVIIDSRAPFVTASAQPRLQAEGRTLRCSMNPMWCFSLVTTSAGIDLVSQGTALAATVILPKYSLCMPGAQGKPDHAMVLQVIVPEWFKQIIIDAGYPRLPGILMSPAKAAAPTTVLPTYQQAQDSVKGSVVRNLSNPFHEHAYAAFNETAATTRHVPVGASAEQHGSGEQERDKQDTEKPAHTGYLLCKPTKKQTETYLKEMMHELEAAERRVGTIADAGDLVDMKALAEIVIGEYNTDCAGHGQQALAKPNSPYVSLINARRAISKMSEWNEKAPDFANAVQMYREIGEGSEEDIQAELNRPADVDLTMSGDEGGEMNEAQHEILTLELMELVSEQVLDELLKMDTEELNTEAVKETSNTTDEGGEIERRARAAAILIILSEHATDAEATPEGSKKRATSTKGRGATRANSAQQTSAQGGVKPLQEEEMPTETQDSAEGSMHMAYSISPQHKAAFECFDYDCRNKGMVSRVGEIQAQHTIHTRFTEAVKQQEYNKKWEGTEHPKRAVSAITACMLDADMATLVEIKEFLLQNVTDTELGGAELGAQGEEQERAEEEQDGEGEEEQDGGGKGTGKGGKTKKGNGAAKKGAKAKRKQTKAEKAVGVTHTTRKSARKGAGKRSNKRSGEESDGMSKNREKGGSAAKRKKGEKGGGPEPEEEKREGKEDGDTNIPNMNITQLDTEYYPKSMIELIPSELRHCTTVNNQHRVLEMRLEELWASCVPYEPNSEIQTFDINLLEPLFRACGLVKGHECEGWITELGEMRSKLTKRKWEHEMNGLNPEELREADVIQEWVLMYPDGSAMCHEGEKTDAAGTGLIMPLHERGMVAFRCVTRRQHANLAETMGITSGRAIAGPHAHILFGSDCDQAAAQTNMRIPYWIEHGFPRMIPNLITVLTAALLQVLASGGTHCFDTPAHHNVHWNELADSLAKIGTTMDKVPWELVDNRQLNKGALIEFIKTWGNNNKDANNKGNQSETRLLKALKMADTRYSDRDPRYTTNTKLAPGQCPRKEMEVRTTMEPVIASTVRGLRAIKERMLECQDPMDGQRGEVMEARNEYTRVMKRFNTQLWEAVTTNFGQTRREMDFEEMAKMNAHTPEYKTRVAKLRDGIKCAEQLTESLQDQMNAPLDEILQQAMANTVWSTADIAADIMGKDRPTTEEGVHDTAGQLRWWIKTEYEALKTSESSDINTARIKGPYSAWRLGNIKRYFRMLRDRLTNKIIKPKFQPSEFLKYLANKNIRPDTYPKIRGRDDKGEFEFIAPRPHIDPESLITLNTPITKDDILDTLLKFKHNSASSPRSDIGYKAYLLSLPKAVIDLRRASTALINTYQRDMENTWGNWQTDGDEFQIGEEQMNHHRLELRDKYEDMVGDTNSIEEMLEGMEGSDDTRPTEEGTVQVERKKISTSREFKQAIANLVCPEGVHDVVKEECDLMVVMGWSTQDDRDACVACMTKLKPEDVNAMTEEEFEYALTQCKNFRELSLVDSPRRKILGTRYSNKFLEFVMKNELHSDINLGYLPNMDSCGINHAKVNMARDSARRFPKEQWSEIIILVDLVSFFSYIENENILRYQNYLGIKGYLAQLSAALQGHRKNVYMSRGGKIYGPELIAGDYQGSAESCADAQGVSVELGMALKESGLGFTFPHIPGRGSPTCPAVMQVDDLKLIAGGQGKTWVETVEEAKQLLYILNQWALVNRLIFSVHPDPLISKTAAFVRLVDSEGNIVHHVPLLEIIAMEGWVQIPILGPDQSHGDLGIMLHCQHELTVETTINKAIKTLISRLEYLIHKELPIQAQVYSLEVSVLGSLKWVAVKGSFIDWESAETLTGMNTRLVKTIHGMSDTGSTAVVYAPRCVGAIGFPNFIKTIMRRALVAVIKDKNSEVRCVLEWSLYEMDYARIANNIGTVQVMNSSGFFNWDIAHMTMSNVRKLNFACAHTWALAACMEFGLRTILINHEGSVTWALAPYPFVQEVIQYPGLVNDGTRVVIGSSQMTKWITKRIHNEYIRTLEQQVSGALLADKDKFKLEMSNRWRSDRGVSSATYKFGVKAWAGLVVTPYLMCKVWKTIASGVCPMWLCGYKNCNLEHIENHCEMKAKPNYLSSLRTVRHNGVLDKVSGCLRSAATTFNYVGEHEVEPPGWMVPEDWKHQLRLITKANWDRLPCKPDLIVANYLAADKITIRIMDVIISWDTRLGEGAEHKIQKYAPMCAIIRDHIIRTTDYNPDIKVVPIVIGVRGTIPADWHMRMIDLKLTAESTALAVRCSKEALHGSCVIYNVWNEHYRKMERAKKKGCAY